MSHQTPSVRIFNALHQNVISQIRSLFIEYAENINPDFCSQDFDLTITEYLARLFLQRGVFCLLVSIHTHIRLAGVQFALYCPAISKAQLKYKDHWYGKFLEDWETNLKLKKAALNIANQSNPATGLRTRDTCTTLHEVEHFIHK